jgi:hypothetical protein
MDMLERRVEILERLPERVTALETQIVLLRDEMRAEFSATRAETRAGDERVIQALREEIGTSHEQVMQALRGEIRTSSEQVMQTLRGEIRTSNEQVMQTVSGEIRAGDEETRRFMRVLYEDLVRRIELLGERF